MTDDQEMTESAEDLKNDEWFKENYLDLIQEHPREWIAVMDRKIIAIGSTEVEAENLANEVAGEKEYSIYFVAPTATVTDSGYSNQ